MNDFTELLSAVLAVVFLAAGLAVRGNLRVTLSRPRPRAKEGTTP